MSAGLYLDTSAAAFKKKSTFAFTFWVKPGKFQNGFHCPILSASVNCQLTQVPQLEAGKKNF
jgi:hypothetical protein